MRSERELWGLETQLGWGVWTSLRGGQVGAMVKGFRVDVFMQLRGQGVAWAALVPAW